MNGGDGRDDTPVAVAEGVGSLDHVVAERILSHTPALDTVLLQ
jgi:hypothetical protein